MNIFGPSIGTQRDTLRLPYYNALATYNGKTVSQLKSRVSRVNFDNLTYIIIIVKKKEKKRKQVYKLTKENGKS